VHGMSVVEGEQRGWEMDEMQYFAKTGAHVDALVEAADLTGLLCLVHDDLLHWGAWLKRHLFAWFEDQEAGTAMGTILPGGGPLGPLGLTRPILGVGEVARLLELAVGVDYATAFRRRFDGFWAARDAFLQSVFSYRGPLDGGEYGEYQASADDQRSALRKHAGALAAYVNLVCSWLRRRESSEDGQLSSGAAKDHAGTGNGWPPSPDVAGVAEAIQREPEGLAAEQAGRRQDTTQQCLGDMARALAARFDEWLSRAEGDFGFVVLQDYGELLLEVRRFVARLHASGHPDVAKRIEEDVDQITPCVAQLADRTKTERINGECDSDSRLVDKIFGTTTVGEQALTEVRAGVTLIKPVLLGIADRDQMKGVEGLLAQLQGSGDGEAGQQPAMNRAAASGQEGEASGLRPSDQKAYSQYLEAKTRYPDLDTDNDVYDWLSSNTDDDDKPYQLTRKDTWKRQVRRARNHHGTQKNKPRAGRGTGSSIVGSNEIEYQHRTDGD